MGEGADMRDRLVSFTGRKRGERRGRGSTGLACYDAACWNGLQEGKGGAGPVGKRAAEMEVRPRGSWAARAKIRERKKEIKSFFLFFLTHFQIQFKLKFNSFANFNQTKASQNKYAAACMHIHVCRPIFDFKF